MGCKESNQTNNDMVDVQNLEQLPAKKALTNSADPGQTASDEAVLSQSSLFAILANFL